MSRRRARSRAVALACVAVFAFAACSDDEAPTRDQAGVVTKAGKVSVFELKPGDCLDPPADVSGEIAEIRVVPCTDPHTQEVFAKPDSTTEAYPGAEALAAEADGLCVAAMQTELLLSPDDGYYWSYLLPSFKGWNTDNDRTVICVFVFPNGPSVTGSVVAQAKAGTVQPGDPPPVSAVPSTLGQGG